MHSLQISYIQKNKSWNLKKIGAVAYKITEWSLR